jgi:CRISPR/Cas system CMR-associated protein Cmr1 (group 7 of RAMP superfamily)
MTPRELANEHSRKHNTRTTDGDSDTPKKIRELQERIKQLEEALEAVAKVIGPPGKSTWVSDDQLNRAWELYILTKEAK